jgi:hypothetical protein
VKRLFIALTLSLVLISGNRLAAEQIEVQFQVRPATKADNNREIIELLKQVIQKLEAQNAAAPDRGRFEVPKAELEAARKQLEAALKAQQQRLAQSNEELQKALQEVEQARKRLLEAEEKLRKIQGGAGWIQAPPGLERRKAVEIKPEPKAGAWKVIEIKAETKPATAADPKREALEKRLDALMKEIEELRRELKKSK